MKVNQLNSLLEGGQIRIASRRTRIVDERQVLCDISVGPVGEEQVQQSLVATVKAALLHGKVQQFGVRVQAGLVHKHTGVEAVWPADIRGGRKLFAFKELIGVLQHLNSCVIQWIGLVSQLVNQGLRTLLPTTHQGVSVQEHTFVELSQAPAVQLGECNAQFGAGEQGQIGAVL